MHPPPVFVLVCDSLRHVAQRWVRVWSVTVTWPRAQDSPAHTTRWQGFARTPAHLRRLITAARADPHASYKYASLRILEGDQPTHCGNGHQYMVSFQGRRLESVDCACGGHLRWVCRCGDRHLDPPPGLAVDCLLAPDAD